MTLLTLPESGALSPSERAKALVFEDAKSRALLERILAAAETQLPVLITGEVGTGRELVARHVHELGARRNGPFLTVACSRLTEGADLALFGRDGEARTASSARIGFLEAAAGGTLYLDGVGDLPVATQARLLKALQDRVFTRVGSRHGRRLDVRLIAASEFPLQEAVAAGRFSRDLLSSLERTALTVLPLRDRAGDILPLARHFLLLYQQRIGIGARELSAEAELALQQHAWPGNIRELETVIHHALLRCRGRHVTPSDLRLAAISTRFEEPGAEPRAALERALLQLFEQSPPNLHELIDEMVMRAAYRYASHNQLKTARLLGISRNVVRARLIQYGEIPGLLRQGKSSSLAAPALAAVNENG